MPPIKASLRAEQGVEFALPIAAFLAPARGVVGLHNALCRHGETGAVGVAGGSAEPFDRRQPQECGNERAGHGQRE